MSSDEILMYLGYAAWTIGWASAWALVGYQAGRLSRDTADATPEEHNERMPDHMRTAVHESGHTICAWLSAHVTRIEETVLLNDSVFRGRMQFVMTEVDSHTGMWDRIVVLLAGIAAESVVFGTFRSMEASYDLTSARDLSILLVARGRGPEPGATLCPWKTPSSQEELFDVSKVFRSIPEGSEEAKILNACYQRAKHIIRDHDDVLRRMAHELFSKKKLTHQDVRRIFTRSIFAT